MFFYLFRWNICSSSSSLSNAVTPLSVVAIQEETSKPEQLVDIQASFENSNRSQEILQNNLPLIKKASVLSLILILCVLFCSFFIKKIVSSIIKRLEMTGFIIVLLLLIAAMIATWFNISTFTKNPFAEGIATRTIAINFVALTCIFGIICFMLDEMYGLTTEEYLRAFLITGIIFAIMSIFTLFSKKPINISKIRDVIVILACCLLVLILFVVILGIYNERISWWLFILSAAISLLTIFSHLACLRSLFSQRVYTDEHEKNIVLVISVITTINDFCSLLLKVLELIGRLKKQNN